MEPGDDRNPFDGLAAHLESLTGQITASPKLVALTQIGEFVLEKMKTPSGPIPVMGGAGPSFVLERQPPRRRVIPARDLMDLEEHVEGTIIAFGFRGRILVAESIEQIQIKGGLSIS